jgi:hypothetical protein
MKCSKMKGKNMKKILLLSFLMLGLVFVTTPVMAIPYDTLVVDVDAPNTGWWLSGSDVNPSLHGQLINSNEATETAWAEGILGTAYSGTFTTTSRKLAGVLPLTGNAINAYYPGFAWDYVVVKYGNFWALYADEGDNLLNTPAFSIPGANGFGVSHVTFFNPTMVPEPTTMLLLGLGLVGLAGIRRKI